MSYLLSYLPHQWLQRALYRQWYRTLTYEERLDADCWGTHETDPRYRMTLFK
jgi:hypothetical protein